MVLLLISSFITFLFLGCYKAKYDVSCASEIFYRLEEEEEGKGCVFTAWTIICGGALLPVWLELTPSNFQFLAFLSVVFFFLVGFFPEYKTEQKTTHYVGAIGCLTMSLMWAVFAKTFVFVFPIILGIFIFCKIKKRTDWLYWVELASFTALFATLFFRL